MSLHALAGHMATKGRGGDSMLVHMTPEEVQSLQALALKGGGSLTINPDTGLPEANFLKKMLPMIAGAALNFFVPGLGAAVGGAFGLGAAAGTGIAVGGLTSLATGSLSRGLMAGLGAYGGASLVGGVANAGTGALSSEAASTALADAGMTGAEALSPAADQLAQNAIGQKLAATTPYETLSAGFKSITDSPAAFGNFAKNNMGAGLAAISPMMADEGVQTTTKRPDTGYIRNYSFDPYTQRYTDIGSYPASEYKGMAQGGIVALAAGGMPANFDQNYVNQLVKEAATQAGGTLSFSDASNAAQNLGISPAMLSSAASNTGLITGAPSNASGFDQNAYMQNKLAQMRNTPSAVLPEYQGSLNDPRYLESFMASRGLTPEQHYQQYGRAEGVTPYSVAAMTSPAGTSNPYGNAQNPGDRTFNADGSITAQANIPGRPYGGFTSMEQLRDSYTQGGGSLGYANDAPETMEDFDQRFKKQTGDSAAAYEYLMGQGAYPTKSGVEQIMRPYNEVTLGMPVQEGRPTQQFIFENGQYRENPNYVPVSYNSKGERVVGTSQTEAFKGFDALAPAQTKENFDYEAYLKDNPDVQSELDRGIANFGNKNDLAAAAYNHYTRYGQGEKRPFTMLADAKPADDSVFEWADTNKVSDAQLAPLMGLSVAEVARRRKKIKEPANVLSAIDPNTTYGGANGGLMGMAAGGYAVGGGLGALAGGGATSQYNLGGYSDGGRLLRGPGDGVSDSIPATIGDKQPARLADGEFVVPARIVSELGNGSTEAGARKLYAMMDRVQKARGKTTGKNRVAANTRADKYLPA